MRTKGRNGNYRLENQSRTTEDGLYPEVCSELTQKLTCCFGFQILPTFDLFRRYRYEVSALRHQCQQKVCFPEVNCEPFPGCLYSQYLWRVQHP